MTKLNKSQRDFGLFHAAVRSEKSEFPLLSKYNEEHPGRTHSDCWVGFGSHAALTTRGRGPIRTVYAQYCFRSDNEEENKKAFEKCMHTQSHFGKNLMSTFENAVGHRYKVESWSPDQFARKSCGWYAIMVDVGEINVHRNVWDLSETQNVVADGLHVVNMMKAIFG